MMRQNNRRRLLVVLDDCVNYSNLLTIIMHCPAMHGLSSIIIASTVYWAIKMYAGGGHRNDGHKI